jgi:hypothetical protein
MAKLGYSVEDVQAQAMLDPGTYHVRVNQVLVKDEAEGKRGSLILQMVVASGDNMGFPTSAFFALPTAEDAETKCQWEVDQGLGDKARTMQGFLLDFIQGPAVACGVAWGKSGFDPDEFMGKECMVDVKHGLNKNTGAMQVNYGNWRPYSG